jgi:hypothetical protein
MPDHSTDSTSEAYPARCAQCGASQRPTAVTTDGPNAIRITLTCRACGHVSELRRDATRVPGANLKTPRWPSQSATAKQG